jgi:hypothetical protein
MDTRDELGSQVDAMIHYICRLAPEVQVEYIPDIFEDEHANLEVYPPLSWDDERCLDLQEEIGAQVVDVHVKSGYLIGVYVYMPEQQIAKAQQELEKARKKQHKAQKILAEAERLGLYRTTGVE